MNKKRGIFAICAVALICLVAIGYAAVTGTAVITGTTGANAGTASLIFTAAAKTSASATLITDQSVSTPNNNQATFTATGFSVVGEEAVFTFTLKNASTDYNVESLTANVTGGNTTVWSVTPVFGTTTLAPDANTTVTVTVRLIKAVTEVTNASWTITVTGTGTPV